MFYSSEFSRGTEGQEAEFRLKGLIIIINSWNLSWVKRVMSTCVGDELKKLVRSMGSKKFPWGSKNCENLSV